MIPNGGVYERREARGPHAPSPSSTDREQAAGGKCQPLPTRHRVDRSTHGLGPQPRCEFCREFSTWRQIDGRIERRARGTANAAQALDFGTTRRTPLEVRDHRPHGFDHRGRSQSAATRAAPADNAPREDIDDERHVDKASPGRDGGEVRHPELIRTVRFALALHQIRRPGLRLRRRDPRTATAGAGEP